MALYGGSWLCGIDCRGMWWGHVGGMQRLGGSRREAGVRGG